MEKEQFIEITSDSLESANWNASRLNRHDIEASFSYFNPLFFVIASVLVWVFAVQVLKGLYGMEDAIDMANFTYRYSNYRLGGNHWWIVSSMFLHGGIGHLVGNLLFLYAFCLVSYRISGFTRSLLVFIVTGIFSGIASFYLWSIPSVGASGAIFGMFGYLSVFYVLKRNELTENLEDLSWVMVVTAVLQILSGFTVPYIDNYAHLGGFIAGCVLWYVAFGKKT